MDALVSYGFAAVILFALVQWIKKTAAARNINPLIILAVLSLVGGTAYAFLINFGWWSAIIQFFGVVAPIANLIYTVLAELTKNDSGRTPLSQKSL